MPVYLIIGDLNFGHLVKLAFARFTDNKVMICPFVVLNNLKEFNVKVKLSPAKLHLQLKTWFANFQMLRRKMH